MLSEVRVEGIIGQVIELSKNGGLMALLRCSSGRQSQARNLFLRSW